MNQDRFAGLCMQFKGRLIEQIGNLSGNPLTAAEGRRHQLAGRIQEQRGLVKEMNDRQLDDFLARNRGWRDASNK